VATVVQAQLAELNINVNISKYAWPTYLEKIMNGEHDLCMMGWSPDFADRIKICSRSCIHRISGQAGILPFIKMKK
jgi:ABC-type transport system substrate-binding protein